MQLQINLMVLQRAYTDHILLNRYRKYQFWKNLLLLNLYAPYHVQSNRLNNRKARLARAAKDNRALPEVENNARDKSESPESPGMNETYVSSSSRGRPRSTSRITIEKSETAEFSRFEPGQRVALVDTHGDEVGRGTVIQVRGSWCGRSLDDMETYVVEITDLKARRWLRLPHPSEATGNSFEEAEAKLGTMRVLWDSNKVINRPNK